MECSTDRSTATYLMAPSLGAPDCRVADFTDIQTAINALPPAGGKVFVKAGTYVVSQTILIQQSNVQVQGEGMDIANIVAAATMTAAPAIRVYKQQAGNASPLLADTAKDETETSATLTSASATHLTSGNFVLLFSNKPLDTEDPQEHAGEVKQIVAVDLATGTITFDDQIYDGHLVSDSAATARITMLQNVTLADFSGTTLAPFLASMSCRFIDNLLIEHVESHHTYVLFEPRGDAERRLQHPGAAFGARHAQPGRIPARAAHPKLLTVSSPLGSSPSKNRSPPLDSDPRGHVNGRGAQSICSLRCSMQRAPNSDLRDCGPSKRKPCPWESRRRSTDGICRTA